MVSLERLVRVRGHGHGHGCVCAHVRVLGARTADAGVRVRCGPGFGTSSQDRRGFHFVNGPGGRYWHIPHLSYFPISSLCVAPQLQLPNPKVEVTEISGMFTEAPRQWANYSRRVLHHHHLVHSPLLLLPLCRSSTTKPEKPLLFVMYAAGEPGGSYKARAAEAGGIFYRQTVHDYRAY
jgi:hypothetical protein